MRGHILRYSSLLKTVIEGDVKNASEKNIPRAEYMV